MQSMEAGFLPSTCEDHSCECPDLPGAVTSNIGQAGDIDSPREGRLALTEFDRRQLGHHPTSPLAGIWFSWHVKEREHLLRGEDLEIES